MAKFDAKKRYSLIVTLLIFGIILVIILVVSRIFGNSSVLKYANIAKIDPLVIAKAIEEPNKEAANITIINEIKRAYNLDILYGAGTESMVKSVNASVIYDAGKANAIILEFLKCLEKYPQNIIREIQMKNYTVEVYLVDHFNNNNLALSTRDVNNNFKIYISSLSDENKSAQAIHHEMYHILEYYMKLQYNIDDLYKQWNDYNPSGFEYNSNVNELDSTYVYKKDGSNSNNAYFVSIYSKVSEKEDRAEVFADTMIATAEPGYYTDDLGAIRNKMELISNALRHTFDSVKNEDKIEWEKYL